MSARKPPYLLFPEDPLVARGLVLINDAAEHFRCSADTLKNNAKRRRLAAYQAAHGTPVFVALRDVADLLRSRRDIGSAFRTSGSTKSTSSDFQPPVPICTGAAPSSAKSKPAGRQDFPLTSLFSLSLEQLALVASCLEEIARYLRPTLAAGENIHPPDAGVQAGQQSPCE